MEGFISSQGQKQNQQTPPRKYSWNGSQKDLWLAVLEGSLTEVDSVLALVKKNGGNINSRNMFGLTPLHIATWRNHIPIVRRLLAAGADPDARDGESGWSSLHRALHFGHLALASILLQCGASITAEDSKSRTPIDLLSGSVFKFVANEHNSVATELFSWGSGVNYQLGTGNAHIQKLPCKVDSLHGCFVKVVSAAKFHSVAVSARGEVYTWGFGRGGRLGHPEFDIHSGQAAVITPRQVTSGLGSRRVKLIAAAKHHTIIATEGGEVFTWGSNREGQLGYTSVDTQPTPRRVSSLRSKIVAVAAANKHTAVISESGEVFTWGCNKEGQLGYGTSNSASNYTPRVVEYLKGKILRGVAAAKKHTIVLGTDGEVFTWGHRLVTPRRVVVARNNKKSGGTLLKFHRMERLHVVAIAAGMVHSMALTDDGTLFYWVSSDPDLRCQQLFSLCGKNMVSISAGKYWTAAVTSTGDVYMWDGKKGKDKPPVPTRLYGIKRATSVAVGETHLLMVGSLYHPVYPLNEAKKPQKSKASVRDDLEDYNEDFVFNEVESNDILSTIQKDDVGNRSVPSLKCLCEKVAAEFLVEPRNAIQVLEIADSLGADNLKKYCEEIVICNFDYILTVSSHAVASTSPDILANLENLLNLRSSEPWSCRKLPSPTSTFPVVITSEEEDSESDFLRIRDNHTKNSISNKGGDRRLDCFLNSKNGPNEGFCKQVRAIRKKLQQIEMLEAKRFAGHLLDDQQISKLQTKSALECLLAELGVPVEERLANASSSVPPDGKCSKRLDVSGKQKRKSKQKVTQVEAVSGDCGTDIKPEPIKSSLDVEMSQVSKHKEGDTDFGESAASQAIKESSFCVQKKDIPDLPRNRSSLATTSKKKNKKGGLSMFLSGALDDAPKAVVPPPPTPKSEGPAWGGVKVSKGSTSLREILDEQSKRKEIKTTTDKDNMEDLTHKMKKDNMEDQFDERCSGKIPLSSLFSSNPIPMVSTCTSQVSDGERSTPPWAASSGTPPLLSRPSLRDIQMQQIKPQACLSHSPKTRTAGFIVATGQASPSDSAGSNCWYKPEVDSPSSIRSIQIEERAIKDLKRFYSSVKLVKNQS